jgi:hypothetical protein
VLSAWVTWCCESSPFCNLNFYFLVNSILINWIKQKKNCPHFLLQKHRTNTASTSSRRHRMNFGHISTDLHASAYMHFCFVEKNASLRRQNRRTNKQGRVWLPGPICCMTAAARWEPLCLANGPWATFGESLGSLCGLLSVGEGTHAPSFGCPFPAYSIQVVQPTTCLVADSSVLW